jgi:lipopolysaccharide/colanic/teichoic acid biosynthesis glycosyltransferase
MKRLLDVIVSATACLVFLPLFAACALAVKLTSPGPALFRQPRLGKGGRPFALLKFRTMYVDSADLRNPDGSAYTCRADPRVTAVGRFLREWSLDELPQLFNILNGEMSLVGPRPDQVDQLRFYTAEEKRKLSVKPGLTGLAQINGRNSISWESRKALDIQYARSRSLWLDARILFRTVPYVLQRRGVNS